MVAYEIIGSVVGSVMVVIIAFYIQKYLQNRSDYNKLKEITQSDTAGKGANIIYNSDIYTIENIDHKGLILQNDLQKIFVPIKKILENEIILPSKDYKKIKKEKEEIEEYARFERYFEKLINTMEEHKKKHEKQEL